MNAWGIDRPQRGHFYLGAWQELKKQVMDGDPQRSAVYKWEKALFLCSHPLVEGAITQASVRSAAVTRLEHLWGTYSPRFDPYFPGLPHLRIGSLKRAYGFNWGAHGRGNAGHANSRTHTIYLACSGLYQEVLAHEVAHLLAWRDHHGPQFCAALLHLWQHEFGIDRVHALAEAERLRVCVAGAQA